MGRKPFSLNQTVAGALIAALLLFGFARVPAAQTITNVANATWQQGANTFTVSSNRVATTVTPTPTTLGIWGKTQIGSGTNVAFPAAMCGGNALVVPGAIGSAQGPINASSTASLRVGDIAYIRVTSPSANLNPTAVDSMTVVVTSQVGDREKLQIFETGVNTGVFMAGIPTVAAPPAPVHGNCRLSVRGGEAIQVAAMVAGQLQPVATATANVLADPYGLVFDSEDGTPVSGARVSLVDAATGAPATVFADDGVTPYPSTMIAGQSVSDCAGNVYSMQPGEYRFPLAPLGQYRLVVVPPSPYSAPSVATPAQLAGLLRPDGDPMVIVDGSYGRMFALASLVPVRIDVPLDRPALAIGLSKASSRANAQPGDLVVYTITAQNTDPGRTKRQVVLTDTPSRWLRLRKDSVRINGQAAPTAVTVSADGSIITVALGDLAPGATAIVTYAMAVRGDAPPGQAINRAEAVDVRGNRTVASSAVRIERENIAGRTTIIGRISAGACSVKDDRAGVAGVRVMLEDGSFAITDADGRYHFDGVLPGTHVVQAQPMTLPQGGQFVDCTRNSRSAGSTYSRFVTARGGQLVVVNFSATVPAQAVVAVKPEANAASDREAAGADTDWLTLGDGPTEFVFPTLDHNPRAPAVRVVIRHRAGQKIELSINGKAVDPLAFDGARTAANGAYAISVWRGIPLDQDTTRLSATVRNADASVASTLTRDVHFAATPAKVELVREQSRLTADGATRPVLAVRVLDRSGRPVHAGITGQFLINAPFESAQVQDALQSRALSGLDRAQASWVVKGDDGIALIELAPTMVSGALRVDFNFADGEIRRRQTLDAWMVPGQQKWTLVGLAEGSVGEQTIADQMERRGRFNTDLGDNARVAFYAKGRVRGKYLLTVAYDSARQKDDQRLMGTIDPNAYYTVFADGSDRRFDAATREKLYVRIETATFYALYGDFETGFNQTQLARYQRVATGLKAEVQSGGLHAQAFAARIGSLYRRDEIQGAGISGPYMLSSRSMLANSETISLEVRDRFRSELIVDRRQLTRFVDYDVDLLAGTITFREPILSRDAALNPQFIVAEYEVQAAAGGELNAGVRADYTLGNGAIRIGATAISDTGSSATGSERTALGGLDLKAKLSDNAELRIETAFSRRAGETSTAYLLEVEHHDSKLGLLAYARSADQDFGLGQTNGAERGRRKLGFDARYAISEALSVTGSAWHDSSLTDDSRRTAVQLRTDYRRGNTDLHVGFSSFGDRLQDGSTANSTVVEGGVRQRLLNNRLELEGSSSVALGSTGSIDLPNRHRLSARYAINSDIRLVGTYEIAKGERVNARTARAGFEVAPWAGGKIVGSLGQQDIAEYGKRSFAAFGLAQSYQINEHFTVDATLDASKTLGAFDSAALINADQPASSGGQLGSNGQLAEDFTATTLGATYRTDRWTATLRGEYRDGELADRKGVTFGAIRQLGEGSMVGAGFTWTRANASTGATSEVIDAAIALAHRPADSEFAFLSKLEFRSDEVTGAVAGTTGPEGRTALTVTGDARSRRVIGSVSGNWSPFDEDDGEWYQRSEFGLFLGVRHNLDSVAGYDLAGTTVMAGADARLALGERFELGAVATVRRNLADGTTAFAIGPQIGFSPTKDTLFTIGYNVTGFRDRDFGQARTTEQGLFASAKLKFDAGTFGFLGLNR